MGCGTATLKCLILIFTVLFAIGGLTILIAGVSFNSKSDEFRELLETEGISQPNFETNAPAILLILIGCSMLVIAFLGCCGAIRESYCMINAFAILLLIVFVAQSISLVILFKTNFKESVEKELITSFKTYKQKEASKMSWDKIQMSFQCCGMNNAEDWMTIANTTIPISCLCQRKVNETHNDVSCSKNNYYSNGCVDSFTSVIVFLLILLAIIEIIIMMIELVGICFAFCLANTIKQNIQREAFTHNRS